MENNDKMENLIMLLDDYEEMIVGVHSVGDKINDKETAWIISKKFGFIEQLIKRDKIDLDKVEQEAMSWFTDESPVYGDEIWTDRLIMILSVSNNPIKDLIYYLGKEDEHYTEHGGYKLVFNAKKS